MSEDDIATASANAEQTIPVMSSNSAVMFVEEEISLGSAETSLSSSPAKPASPHVSHVYTSGGRNEKTKKKLNSKDVMQLHAEVLKSQKEVLELKKKKLKLEISLLQRQVNLGLIVSPI